ncbi:MAG: hemerythrin [Bacteroidales bacterium 45-6]|nr:MAG: hemerythrin [Bacteroidales bacterium 45-6]
MSEIINNSTQKKEMLKHLILQLHDGVAPEAIKSRLVDLLKSVPYNLVVEVEQELIAEGLPEEEVLRLCDIHAQVLDGTIDTSQAKSIPQGHPVDTFHQENRALETYIAKAKEAFNEGNRISKEQVKEYILKLKGILNALSDVDKHYKRKEYLLFPYLEKAGITGPPKVMWGKHDQTRVLLKAAHDSLPETEAEMISTEEIPSLIVLVLLPVIEAIEGMIMKEEEILLPMSLDTLSEEDWYRIYQETLQFGFCLYDPSVEWKPGFSKKTEEIDEPKYLNGEAIRLSSGTFALKELEALFVTLPIDITYVDANDKVKFFSHSPNRVFDRNRSILGRDVRLCHPPGSVYIVEQIISDFRSGKENKAAFWISNFKGRFVHIEYTALRGADGEYLGVIEVTQDITAFRSLEGDQRLLSYAK